MTKVARSYIASFTEPKFVKFLFVGAVNTSFGFLVYVGFLRMTNNFFIAIIAANIIGPVFNFFSTGKLVFRNSGFNSFLPFLTGYAVICIFNLALVAALKSLGVSATWAQALCLPLLVIVSYTINNRLVFGARQ